MKFIQFITCLGLITIGSFTYGSTSTFDIGLDGWTSNTPNEISWSATEGNPGGYIRFDDATGNRTFVFAPDKFLGDWSALNGRSDAISYDLQIARAENIVEILPYELRISGPTDSAVWIGDTPTGVFNWTSFTIPLSESEWDVTGSWLTLLNSVDEFAIAIEMIDGAPEIAGIDNVNIVPIPAALPLFGTAIGLMGFLAVGRHRKIHDEIYT